MKKFHITKRNLLLWYFNEDYTQESQNIRESLAEKVIGQLQESNSSIITTRDIFEEINIGAIKLSYLEEFDDTDEGEVSDINFPNEIVLID